jgi:NAD(P)-dependent dehydrogenase (short-subunit alcohol dehydrogenase family)
MVDLIAGTLGTLACVTGGTMSQKTRFSGRVAIVTGAARGIGAATARRLAAEGAGVLLADREPMVEETAVGIGTSIILDITDADAGERLARAALDVFGRIDVLVNNAGIGGSKRLEDSDDALLARFIDTNLTSVLRVTRGVLPHLASPGGAIVNLSSIFGLVGYPGSTAYAAAKGGVAQVTRQLAADLGPKGIRVNAVAPGVVLTPMTQNHFKDPYYTRMLVDSAPLGRYAEPEELAAAIAFLASDDASFITGVVLPVDGGFLAARRRWDDA